MNSTFEIKSLDFHPMNAKAPNYHYSGIINISSDEHKFKGSRTIASIWDVLAFALKRLAKANGENFQPLGKLKLAYSMNCSNCYTFEFWSNSNVFEEAVGVVHSLDKASASEISVAQKN